MFRLILFSIVVSLLIISVKSQSSIPADPLERVYDDSQEVNYVLLDDGDYVEKLINQLTDCNLEKKTDDSQKHREELDDLYKETLIARGLESWVPLHLQALSEYRKEKCSLKV